MSERGERSVSTEETRPGTRVALVTGGSRGIGRAAVTRLAADGYDVAFCYRSRADAAGEVERAATGSGARVLALAADVADRAAIARVVTTVEDTLGPIDVVVTSAGVVRDAPLLMMDDADWHRVLDANLTGTYNVCRSVVFSMMKRKQGSIINLSSVAGVHGNPTQANYSAAKAGIIGFTRALAKEVGRYGIRANVIAPGFIDTDMTAALDERVRAQALAAIPLRRFGSPGEVAELVRFLASDQASYVTGSVFHVDGGIVL